MFCVVKVRKTKKQEGIIVILFENFNVFISDDSSNK